MKKIRIKQIDSFTAEPFSGNPAGVVTTASGLTVKQMRLIAREMNLSETAFVLPPKTPSADMRIRWFTPTSEVNLCGHATIAAFHGLAEEEKYGMSRPGKFNFKIETKSGILPISVKKEVDALTLVYFGLPVPVFENVLFDSEKLAMALKTKSDNFDFKYDLAKDSFQLILPIKTKEQLFAIKPNYFEIENICRKLKVSALTVFTTDTVDSESAVHTRCFVPLLGVNEDPVTGSSQGPLGIYLAEQNIVKGSSGNYSYIGEQGDCLEKAGRVRVEFKKTKDGYKNLQIIGTAVTVLAGEIYLS
ncbi:PhzF family phenazine biosynthesis protein [candidate division KSB1 bacterium]